MSQRFTASNHVSAAAFALAPASKWSVCGWIYIVSSSGGDGDLFYAEPSATPGSTYAIRLGYSHNGGAPTLRFRAGDGTNQLNDTEVVAAGDWNHMCLTYDGAVARAYLDGNEVASQALSMAGSYNVVDIGDFAFGTSVVELAQIKVWQGTALTPAQLALEQLYWRPQTAPANVYAWWQLDAAAPTLDSSGHSRTLSGPGSSNGLFTPPGQLDPVNQNVAALGGTVSNGTAVVRMRVKVAASGQTVSGGRAFVRTSVPSPPSGTATFGGRSRARRGRR